MAKQKHSINLKVRIPQIIVDGRAAEPELLAELAQGLSEVDAKVRVIGKGAESLPHIVSLEEAVETAHIWVILDKKLPAEFNMMVERGVVPVMLNGVHPEAENYSASQEKGNAFLFEKLEAWPVYAAIIRSIENFGFSYDWQTLKNEGKSLLDLKA